MADYFQIMNINGIMIITTTKIGILILTQALLKLEESRADGFLNRK